MGNNKLKKSSLFIGFLILFVGLALVVIDCRESGKLPDFFKGFLVGLGISIVLGSFVMTRIKKQKSNEV